MHGRLHRYAAVGKRCHEEAGRRRTKPVAPTDPISPQRKPNHRHQGWQRINPRHIQTPAKPHRRKSPADGRNRQQHGRVDDDFLPAIKARLPFRLFLMLAIAFAGLRDLLLGAQRSPDAMSPAQRAGILMKVGDFAAMRTLDAFDHAETLSDGLCDVNSPPFGGRRSFPCQKPASSLTSRPL